MEVEHVQVFVVVNFLVGVTILGLIEQLKLIHLFLPFYLRLLSLSLQLFFIFLSEPDGLAALILEMVVEALDRLEAHVGLLDLLLLDAGVAQVLVLLLHRGGFLVNVQLVEAGLVEA